MCGWKKQGVTSPGRFDHRRHPRRIAPRRDVRLEPSSSGQAVWRVQTSRARKILLVRMVRCSHTVG
jgi:hypothetical protein